jgi:hypothetical protein
VDVANQGRPVVFPPCAVDVDHFAADRHWMLNLRVDGMDEMIAALRDAGIGRFGRLRDPEGNAIELW